MDFLSKLLGGNTETFLEKHFTRLPFSSQGGALPFTDLLSWKVVENIFEQKKSILRIVKDGAMTKDYADYSFKEAREFYDKGHTLLIKNAELSDTALKKVADDFSQSFRTEVDVQLYCTPEGHNAFGWHFDVEEVFIIQARGSKEYTIRHNTVHPNPLVSSLSKDQGFEKEKSDLQIKVLLKEGDWLYLPSGWWHIARTQAESMHISIGLMPRSAVDILSYLPQFFAHNTFWRTRLPIHKNFTTTEEEIAFYQDAFRTLSKDMVEKMQTPDFIQSFLRHMKKSR